MAYLKEFRQNMPDVTEETEQRPHSRGTNSGLDPGLT